MIDYSLINSGIFIGNICSVISTTKSNDILEERDIKVVISALTEEEYEDNMIAEQDFPNAEWHRLVIDDNPNEPISTHFYTVHTIISKAISNKKNVIVHCAAGMSRSPTLVLAYLMIENKWRYEEAYNYMKTKRPHINPNIGFIKQLKQLEYLLQY
jgi:protein-tyrosine phosphatase